ncbi:nuclear transport factor 2 family protein [Flavobacterium litorale]|uniref:Nuclear transport factor 2 family protein n=1 Tax=Flavobacterium litorale TaxID=2856519 RepID=A0ABX8V8N1_9FLAO|nr:nuclear transport factor 2 family protein [Flavobacterium litorale]QYJ69209.1 nuclear transport factor 2 family protein [Flavobacterium litorale]
MKKLFILFAFTIIGCSTTQNKVINTNNEKTAINTLLDDWHTAAAQADFDGYFDKIATDGYFIGTDATENWDKKAFSTFAKPYFDKGKAWNFKALERNIYFSNDGKTAWFDELLDTWMKVCRGSGVLEKADGKWKIKHYVLSMTVPNKVTKEILPLKAKYEDVIIEELKNQ